MKKLIFILFAFLAITAPAQTTPSYPTVKLTKPATGAGTDEILTIGASKNINKVSKASLLSGVATTTYVDAADATKAPIASPTFTGTVSGITKVMVGLGNVDNTTDAAKPVSTATQTALNAKQATLVSGTSIKTINGNSLLGSGDITISGGGGSTAPLEFNTTNLTVWNNGKGDITSNTSFGDGALKSNISTSQQTAFGYEALASATSGGGQNVAVGYASLFSTTTGGSNTGIGSYSLQYNTGGGANTSIGFGALRNQTTGNFNVAIGHSAGEIVANSANNTICGSSIFLGTLSKALDNNQNNQIVIGFNATGAGSNTATLGNTSIVKTVLRGKINAAGMPVYADNAAAIAGGLEVGDEYRTSTGDLKIVY